MIIGYVSAKAVIAKLYRDLKINTEINEAHVYEWIGEILEKIGSYYQYTEIKECLDLVDGKAALPCNFYRIKDIVYGGYPVVWASNSVTTNYTCEGCVIPTCCSEYEFYINDRYIITNINSDNGVTEESPKLCIVYLGVPVDSDGYPMVPDDAHFMDACAKYVTYMLDYSEWRKGNIPDKVLERSERDYLWAVGAAKGSANMPGTGQLERLKNIWTKLIPNMNEYNKSFINNGKQERRYRY